MDIPKHLGIVMDGIGTWAVRRITKAAAEAGVKTLSLYGFDKGGSLQRRSYQTFEGAPVTELDLVICTGGQRRLSDFLLRRAGYAEFVFSPQLWPEFTVQDLWAAFQEYASRGRIATLPGRPLLPINLQYN